MKASNLIITGIILVLCLFTLISALFQVDQAQQVVVTEFGKPVRVILNPVMRDEERLKALEENYRKAGVDLSYGPGLKMKAPFVQKVHFFDRRLLSWDGYPEEIPTRDKKYIWVDATARWYIEDPLMFLQNVRTETTAQARLDDIIDSVLRDAVTGRVLIESVRSTNREMLVTEEELQETVKVDKISEGRDNITREVIEKARAACRQLGIDIVDVRIKRINYVESVKIKIEDRMIAERKRIAELYRSEGQGEHQKIMGAKEKELKTVLSAAYKEGEGIKGKADAEAIKVYAESYNRDPEFYQFYNTLELYKKLGSDTRFVMGMDNELFKYLKDFHAPAE